MSPLFKYLPFLVCILFAQVSLGQQGWLAEVTSWQKKLNKEYTDPETSPLPKKAIRKFEGLDFYPIDSSYQVIAKLQLTPAAVPLTMSTSDNRSRPFKRYGIASFLYNGRQYELPVYKSIVVFDPEYKDYLFIPFTDQTSGYTSYGGGRYLDIRIPENPDRFIIDFNKAYNPYCAYSANYSCPIPPAENYLDFEVKAGVKAWEKD